MKKFIIMLFSFIVTAALIYKGNYPLDNYLRDNVNSTVTDAESKDYEEYEKKQIALTFDDGPGQYTEKLLDGLKERNVKATFFLIGESVQKYPDIVKRMYDEGHLIGNHTYSHVELACISVDEAVLEIEKTNSVIEEITGEKVGYIRPPYGHWTRELEDRVLMEPVMWDVDPRDWSVLDKQKVTCHIINNISEGDIILLHDIFETSVDAALNVIDILEINGYEFVTVEELYG